VISTSSGAALVKGAAPNQTRLVKVEVTRAFCINGARREVGDVVEVHEVLARELASLGKASPCAEKLAAKPTAGAEKQKPTTKGS
jgi:hypothetical protein